MKKTTNKKAKAALEAYSVADLLEGLITTENQNKLAILASEEELDRLAEWIADIQDWREKHLESRVGISLDLGTNGSRKLVKHLASLKSSSDSELRDLADNLVLQLIAETGLNIQGDVVL